MATSSASKSMSQGCAMPLPRNSSPHDFGNLVDFNEFMSPGPAAALTTKPVSGKRHCTVTLAAIVERSCLQTRPPFDPQHDAEDAALVESLRVRGQDTPVILEQIAERRPAEYRIKDGHRRIDALRHIGAERVEAIILQSGTPQSDLITLTGNVRKNFSPMEWARALERLLQDGQSLAEIARATGLVHQRLSDWKQLLDLAPDVQAALEQGRISLQVALALGKAPLSFQPELARLAVQTDLTEIKARQLAERVRDSLAAEGPAAVEVTQLAATLGLVPASVESVADSPGSATDAPTLPLATPHAPVVTPHRKNAPGRTSAKAISGEAALHVLRAHFPALESHGLANQAATRGMNEKTLLLAGLMVQEDRLEVVEAVEGALTLPLTPEIRAQLSGLDTVAREYDLLEHGQWDEKAERLLHIQWLVAKQVERVKQAAQARKKPRATSRKNGKGTTA